MTISLLRRDDSNEVASPFCQCDFVNASNEEHPIFRTAPALYWVVSWSG
jgi:hypothetical protein